MREDQGVLLCREIEDASLTGRGLLRKHVEDWGPFRMFQVERIEHCIGNVQQMLPLRSDRQGDVSRGVSERGDSVNARYTSELSPTKVSLSLMGSMFRRAVSTMTGGALVVAASDLQKSHSRWEMW